ncbi:MAG: TatD family hydrolase, partial [Chlorobia bacterium]|nr:TatD family hydrolase [Fimbriimonadaceae bacterium]
MLIDTHCHLNLTDHFPDPASEVAFAKSMGVERLIVVGVDLESSQVALDLAEKFEEVFAVVGIHPNHSADYKPEWIDAI